MFYDKTDSLLFLNIPSLRELWSLKLSYNKLTICTLPDDIGELKELVWLDVAVSPLTLEDMRKVVKLQNKMFSRDVTSKDKKCPLFVYMLRLVN